MTISHFRQLRELELQRVDWFGSAHESLLSSITSPELRKIIFPLSRAEDRNTFLHRAEVWTSIDRQLYELMARLGRTGYRYVLGVELRLSTAVTGDMEHSFTKILPKFREKGVLTVVDTVHGDLVLHSSTHGR